MTAYEGSTTVVYDIDTDTAAKQEEKLSSGELASAAGVNVLDVSTKDDSGSSKSIISGGKYYKELELSNSLTVKDIQDYLCKTYLV